MTNKELMYAFAEPYVDNILLTLVNHADKILSDPVVSSLMQTLVDLEQKERSLRYSFVIHGSKPDRSRDSSAYRTVMYDLLIRDQDFDQW